MTFINSAVLQAIAPKFVKNKERAARQAEIIRRAGPFFGTILPLYGITGLLRQAHFLAQTCEESFGYSRLEEEASGKRYEGRKSLGNSQPGDGPRFKGRGFIQITGRTNYRVIGKALQLDLEENPTQVDDPRIAVRTACEFWIRNHLNLFADADNLRQITRIVNGPLMNGLQQRAVFLAKAKAVLSAEAHAPLFFEGYVGPMGQMIVT